MARVTKQMSDALKAAGLWGEYTTRRRHLLSLGIKDYGSVKILCDGLLAGESGDDIESRLMKKAGLVPDGPHEPEAEFPKAPAEIPAYEVGDRPPPLRLAKLGPDFWRRKASPNEVVAWVVRNYMNPDLDEADFPDPSALTLLVTARKSMDMWESVFGAYQKMVSSKTGEERDDGIDGQREYDLLARFQELEAGR